MHTFTSLIGAPLRVELQSAKIFEGILTVGKNICKTEPVNVSILLAFFIKMLFQTFSPSCEAVLEQVHEVKLHK